MNEHYQFVYRYLYWLGSDRESAEDLTQETFLRAWRGMNRRAAGAGSDRAWLATIARRAAADRDRRCSVERVPLAAAGEIADGRRLPAEQAVDADEDRRLRSAVAALPEPYRSAVVLTKIEEMDTVEAASALGIPRGTLKWRIARGLTLLRERLAGREPAPPGEVRHHARSDVRR